MEQKTQKRKRETACDLPYLFTFTTLEQFDIAWKALQTYCELPKRVGPYTLARVDIDPTFQGEYWVIQVERDLYYKLNFITDFFTEPSRLRCKRFNQSLSPSEYWDLHQHECDALFSYKQKRDWLYAKTTEVNGFRLSVAVSLLDFFRPRRVFDPCAGHGDRALACLSRDYIQSYTACEPNTFAHKLISRAIDAVSQGDRRAIVHNVPFEDHVFQEGDVYDFVITSPPYYNVEEYCDEDTQSIKRYRTQDTWYKDFLLPMFVRCLAQLQDGGHMLISINNVWNKETQQLQFCCTERLVSDLCKVANFLGTIAYEDRKRNEPIFIWRKEIS